MRSGALSGRATTAPCSGRRNGARRYGWGRPVCPNVGARLARRPTLVRATGRSSLSRYRERHPDKSVEQRCQEGDRIGVSVRLLTWPRNQPSRETVGLDANQALDWYPASDTIPLRILEGDGNGGAL